VGADLPERGAPDPVRDRLLSLRSEADSLVLAPPSTVRARGETRARRQRAATATAFLAAGTAAVIAGSAWLPGGMIRDEPARPADMGKSVVTVVTTTAPSGPRTTTPTTVSSSTGPAAPLPSPDPPGRVNPRLFLPTAQWVGPDVLDSARLRWYPQRESEGAVGVGACDADASETHPDFGRTVGAAWVQEVSGEQLIGAQRIRIMRSEAAAAEYLTQMEKRLDTCLSQPVNDYVPKSRVERVTRIDDPAVDLAYRIDVTCPGCAEDELALVGSLTQWVTAVRVGRTVTVIGLGGGDPVDLDGESALLRIASAASAHLEEAG